LNKQGTTGKRKYRTLVPHKSEVIRELRMVKIGGRLWLHTTDIERVEINPSIGAVTKNYLLELRSV
jgi:hypothetical protein